MPPLPHLLILPFRDLDSKSHKALTLGGENDRVLHDLWGDSNAPVVLNNPYSEKEQVSAAARPPGAPPPRRPAPQAPLLWGRGRRGHQPPQLRDACPCAVPCELQLGLEVPLP